MKGGDYIAIFLIRNCGWNCSLYGDRTYPKIIGGFEMKKIQQLKELLALKQELQEGLMQYLVEEFSSLYEYLNNGEKLEDFMLPDYQNMVILEGNREINKILSRTLDLEFVEEVKL